MADPRRAEPKRLEQAVALQTNARLAYLQRLGWTEAPMKTLDPRAEAKIPGQLAPARRKFARYYGHTPMEMALLCLGSFLPLWGAPPVLGMKACAWRWLRTREHLQFGCLCPSMIVDREQQLVATFTNLNARGERSIPAIQITAEPLHLLPRSLAEEGTQLASACLFTGTEKSFDVGYWDDFTPLLVDCLVSDQAACTAARGRLKRLAWTALMMGVAELKGHHSIGLHRVSVPHEVTCHAF
ncbi:MAG: DUF3239 domain-containing protein [Opitutaceae bacterium]|nr:DUF3239 domain-containing protein [Opitutaceae bacterium]